MAAISHGSWGVSVSDPRPNFNNDQYLGELTDVCVVEYARDRIMNRRVQEEYPFMLIRAKESVLVVIDMQERLVPAMLAPDRTLGNASLLLSAAQTCEVPVILTEQYPEGLGRTVSEVADLAGKSPIIEKMHFSCMEVSDFRHCFSQLNRKQAVLAGMEAHVCVAQSAESLIEAGYDVFVVSDAIASRTAESKATGIARLNSSGASIVTTEMVVFEWLGKAGTPAFRKLLPLIRDTPGSLITTTDSETHEQQ